VNAPVRKPLIAEEIRADALTVFIERAEAMARLWQTGEILLCDAVDRVWQAAEAYGVVIALGQDEVQRRMAEVFAAVRRADATPTAANFPDDQYEGLSSTFAAACRVADTKQTCKPRDLRIERLRKLMDDDVSIERAWAELHKRVPGDVPRATVEAAEHLAFQQNDLQRLKDWLAPRSHEDRAAIRKHLSKRGSSCR
jgi:hypothetical protein